MWTSYEPASCGVASCGSMKLGILVLYLQLEKRLHSLGIHVYQ